MQSRRVYTLWDEENQILLPMSFIASAEGQDARELAELSKNRDKYLREYSLVLCELTPVTH